LDADAKSYKEEVDFASLVPSREDWTTLVDVRGDAKARLADGKGGADGAEDEKVGTKTNRHLLVH
jgi:hypothetical protein